MKEGLLIGNLQEKWEESKKGTIRLDLAWNNLQQHTLFAWVTLSEDSVPPGVPIPWFLSYALQVQCLLGPEFHTESIVKLPLPFWWLQVEV